MSRILIAPLLLIATTSACSSATTSTPPTIQGAAFVHRQPRMARASWIASGVRTTTQPLLYVADTYAYEVAVYMQQGRNQNPVGEITNGITFPTGVWVDQYRNLWVSNTYGELESNILRFPQGSTKPDRTLADPNWNADDVWVAPDGSVYAINSGYSGNFEIVKYPPHKTVSQPVGDPYLTSDITAIAGDTSGNLFASGLGVSGGGEVDELPAGSTQWQNTGIPLMEPGGLAFDREGHLVVSDIGREVVEVFSLGHKKPREIIQCSAQCWAIALNHRAKRLWVDEVNDLNGTIDEFSYQKAQFVETLAQPSNSYPLGLATTPDLY